MSRTPWFTNLRFAVGDRVRVTIPIENRQWGYDPCPDGTEAIVLGYAGIAYTDDPAKAGGANQLVYIPNIEPGAGVNTCWVRLMFDDGTEHTEMEMRLSLVTASPYRLARFAQDAQQELSLS